MRLRVLLLCGVVLASLVGLAAQQYSTGSISGFVKDSSGAVVPGAAVTLTSEATKLATVSTSQGDGFYNFQNLTPGLYDIRISAKGFKAFTENGVNVDPIGKVAVDATLQLGATSEVVNVTANAEQLQTDTAQVGRVIENKALEELPTNGRNMFSAVFFKTGIETGGTNGFRPGGTAIGSGVNINGSRGDDIVITVDGAQSNRTRSNGALIGAWPIDSIEEAQVLTSNFLPEFGRSAGGQLSFVTKGGGSQFHGSLYEFVRNDILDARSYFATKKEELRFNQPGGSIGGPLFIPGHFNEKKDKMFFFVSEEWNRFLSGATRVATVPTVAERNGDFTNSKLGCPKAGSDPRIVGCTVVGPFSVNGVGILNALPLPNASLSNGNWTAQHVGRDFSRTDVVRVDYNFNEREKMYWRGGNDAYNHFDADRGNLLLAPANLLRPNRSMSLNLTSTISPSLLNDFTFAIAKDYVTISVFGNQYQRSKYGINYNYLLPDGKQIPDKIPSVNLAQGILGLDGGPYPAYSSGPIATWTDNVTKVINSHTFKFGGVMEYSGENDLDQINVSASLAGLGNNQNGTFNFNTAGTGNVLANVLLGNFASYSEIGRKDYTKWRSKAVEMYAQDSWKVNPRLTLEYGLRYSLWQPWQALSNNIAEFDPRFYSAANAVTLLPNGQIDQTKGGDPFNGVVVAGNGPAAVASYSRLQHNLPRGFNKIRLNNVDPRLGFSYDPTGNGNTVIRGGIGIFHARLFLNDSTLLGGNPPLQPAVQVTNGNIDTFSANPSAVHFPIPISAQDYRFPFPADYEWSLGVQRRLPSNFTVDIGYIGKRAIHLQRESDINEPAPNTSKANINTLRPYPGFGGIRYSCNCAQSSYHSLQVDLQRRYTNGLLFGLGYTYSHSIDNASDKRNVLPYYLNDRSYRGSSDFDRPHILQVTYVYELPFFKNANGLVRNSLGGWQVSGVTFAASGSPFTLTIGGTDAAHVGNGAGGQFATLGAPIVINQDSWTNYLAFGSGATKATYIPAPGTFGNVGRNSFRGPGTWNQDFATFKNFSPFTSHENLRLQVRGEYFNLFNHINKTNPNSDVTSGSFGAPGAGGPRTVQLGARLTF